MPLCPTCVRQRPPYPEVTEVICRVPSASFSQAPWHALPVHLCWFRVRSIREGYFQGLPGCTLNFIKVYNFRNPSHSPRPTNVNVVPIDYSFRTRLRGRLTLRRLALRRNPWTFGEGVSHSLYRYSCQHSHFRYLQHPSQDTFAGLRNAPLPLQWSPQFRRVA